MNRNYNTPLPLQFIIVGSWVFIVGSIAACATLVLVTGWLNLKLRGKGEKQ